MTVHARAPTDPNPAKSEVLFVAAPGICYDDAETFSDEHRDGACGRPLNEKLFLRKRSLWVSQHVA